LWSDASNWKNNKSEVFLFRINIVLSVLVQVKTTTALILKLAIVYII
jgi:hypothetical protein